MIRALGCDPGSVLGLCLIELADSLSITAAKFLDGSRLNRRDSIGNELAQDVDIWQRVYQYCVDHRPDIVAIEQPAEAKIIFRGHRKQRTETSYRSGVYYGLALSAFARFGIYRDQERRFGIYRDQEPERTERPPRLQIASYPAVNSKNRGRGWMAGASRKTTVANLTVLLKAIRAPRELLDLGKDGDFKNHHVADALGVLNFHLDQERLRKAIDRNRPAWERETHREETPA